MACAQAFGQVSVLDPSFNVGPGADGAVNALVLQADQRLLVGGEFTTIRGCSNSFLARLKPDGSVDTTFNPAGQTDGFVRCLLQQPDRKVLVGESFGRLLGQTRPASARLLEDGSVDATFDAGRWSDDLSFPQGGYSIEVVDASRPPRLQPGTPSVKPDLSPISGRDLRSCPTHANMN